MYRIFEIRDKFAATDKRYKRIIIDGLTNRQANRIASVNLNWYVEYHA